jgi:hypothetical protein
VGLYLVAFCCFLSAEAILWLVVLPLLLLPWFVRTALGRKVVNQLIELSYNDFRCSVCGSRTHVVGLTPDAHYLSCGACDCYEWRKR